MMVDFLEQLLSRCGLLDLIHLALHVAFLNNLDMDLVTLAFYVFLLMSSRFGKFLLTSNFLQLSLSQLFTLQIISLNPSLDEQI